MQNRGCIPNRTPISKRPIVIEKRSRIGDIKVDVITDKNHIPAPIVLTDRSILETHIIKTKSKKAKHKSDKILRRLEWYKNENMYSYLR